MIKRRLLCCLALVFCQQFVESVYAQESPVQQGSPDGPYVLYTNDDRIRLVSVDSENGITDTLFRPGNSGTTFTVYADKGPYRFDVSLHSFEAEMTVQPAADKLFVLSDPHGDMVSFVSVLQANGVIDGNLNWVYGKGHLVVIGDVFDRGEDVVPIFWLIYKLEGQARSTGGGVHFLLGNHEEMVLRGNLKYTAGKYKRLAEQLALPYASLWGEQSELGRWLRTRNTVLVMGKTLFVHAGLSKAISTYCPDSINRVIVENLGVVKSERDNDAAASFLFGSEGPLWYRGMVKDDEKYHPLSAKAVDKLLSRYRVSRIVVGHTIFGEVTSRYGGKVLTVNVKNDENRKTGKSRGIEISGDSVYLIDDSGVRLPLKR